MITGKELEIMVMSGAIKKCESEYESSFHIYDWQAIANELNQRTCESCANKKQCFQYVMIRQKTSSDILVDVEYKITFCSLYTKEG